jgi:hypothetical protein
VLCLFSLLLVHYFSSMCYVVLLYRGVDQRELDTLICRIRFFCVVLCCVVWSKLDSINETTVMVAILARHRR